MFLFCIPENIHDVWGTAKGIIKHEYKILNIFPN